MATILIVDDERVLCDLLKAVLGSHGHEVFTAYNGREALDLFSQHRPQFTLLDLRMPEMNGIEVLRQIRTIDASAAVMILTGWGSDDLEKQARQLGVTDFLSKTLALEDRKSTRLNSSHLVISYAVFCLKKKKNTHKNFEL